MGGIARGGSMGSIMNGGGGGTLISGAGTLINVKNVGKTMTCPHAQSRAQRARPAPRKRRLKGWRLSTSRYRPVLYRYRSGPGYTVQRHRGEPGHALYRYRYRYCSVQYRYYIALSRQSRACCVHCVPSPPLLVPVPIPPKTAWDVRLFFLKHNLSIIEALCRPVAGSGAKMRNFATAARPTSNVCARARIASAGYRRTPDSRPKPRYAARHKTRDARARNPHPKDRPNRRKLQTYRSKYSYTLVSSVLSLVTRLRREYPLPLALLAPVKRLNTPNTDAITHVRSFGYTSSGCTSTGCSTILPWCRVEHIDAQSPSTRTPSSTSSLGAYFKDVRSQR